MSENILKEISEQLNQCNKMYPKNTEQYNIFNVLEISHKEVIMCRMLADLLNPRGAHKRGHIFLKSFLSEVLQISDVTEKMLEQADVFKEYAIPESGRRIDIVIEVGTRFIPIEVKIEAPEQPSQCYAYYQYAKEKMGDDQAKVYYLTKYGMQPSEYSRNYTDEEGNTIILGESEIVPISFKEHICKWLRGLIDGQTGCLRDVLEQFLEAIEEVTGVVDERVINTVKNIIIESEDNLNAALMIEQSLEKAKIENIRRLFDEFNEQMSEKIDTFSVKLINLGKDSWYSYEQQVDSFYKKQESSYPGINYLVKDAKFEDGKQLWLRIKIDNVLYAGLCMFDPKADDGQGAQIDDMDNDIKSEILKYVNLNQIDNDNWWVKWIYLPTGRTDFNEQIPDFKNMNAAAIALADSEIRKEFVVKSIEEIKEKLISLLRIDK